MFSIVYLGGIILLAGCTAPPNPAHMSDAYRAKYYAAQSQRSAAMFQLGQALMAADAQASINAAASAPKHTQCHMTGSFLNCTEW